MESSSGSGPASEEVDIRLIDPRISLSCGLSGYSCLSQRAAILLAESARRLAYMLKDGPRSAKKVTKLRALLAHAVSQVFPQPLNTGC
jgi:hypothetical protein